jgi:hypothetical protein
LTFKDYGDTLPFNKSERREFGKEREIDEGTNALMDFTRRTPEE